MLSNHHHQMYLHIFLLILWMLNSFTWFSFFADLVWWYVLLNNDILIYLHICSLIFETLIHIILSWFSGLCQWCNIPLVIQSSVISHISWHNMWFSLSELAKVEGTNCVVAMPRRGSPTCGVYSQFSDRRICRKSKCSSTWDSGGQKYFFTTSSYPLWCSWPLLVVFYLKLIIVLLLLHFESAFREYNLS